MSTVDWERYRRCPQCGAALGTACQTLTGYTVNSGSGAVIAAEATEPHPGRELRTGYARTGGGR